MELRELRNFMRVARAGSVSRAAAELRLAQPALSRQIRNLEYELGVPLFIRHGRGVRLSQAGLLLLERAEAIAHLVNRTSAEIRDEGATARGRLTLGVPPAAGRILIPSFAARFQKAWPNMTLHMREGVASLLQEWLLDRRIDLAVLHNPPHLEALEIAPLLRERMWVIGPPRKQSPDRGTPASFRIRDLAALPLILPNTAHTNRRLVEDAALDHGVRLHIKIEADSVAFAKAMVEQGLGYTILTYAAVQDEVRRNKLTAFPIVRPALVTQVTVVSLRDKAQSEATQAASALLHDVCRRLVRNKQWAGAQLG
jgi:LysR family nitrogen assimilation transcriptional regulator